MLQWEREEEWNPQWNQESPAVPAAGLSFFIWRIIKTVVQLAYKGWISAFQRKQRKATERQLRGFFVNFYSYRLFSHHLKQATKQPTMSGASNGSHNRLNTASNKAPPFFAEEAFLIIS